MSGTTGPPREHNLTLGTVPSRDTEMANIILLSVKPAEILLLENIEKVTKKELMKKDANKSPVPALYS